MSFPASLTTREVKGRFVTYPDGTPAKGTVRIALSNYMQGPTDDAFVIPFEVVFEVEGSFSLILPATNDPQWTTAEYRFSFTPKDARSLHQYRMVSSNSSVIKPLRSRFQVPYNATTPLDLADILNLPAPTPSQQYVLLASKGASGGVASLGSDGKVPSSQLPSSSGGSVAWDDVTDKPSTFPAEPQSWTEITDKPSTFPPSTHAHAFAEITDKPSTYPPSTHSHAFVDITGKPATYPHDPIVWAEIENVPASFTPTSHIHAITDVTNLSSTLSGKSDTGHTHAYSSLTGIPDIPLRTEMEAADAALADDIVVAYDAAQLALTGLSSKADAAATTTALGNKFDKSGGPVTGDISVSGYSALHGVGVTGDLTVSGQVTYGGAHVTGDNLVDGYTTLHGTGITGDLAITGSQSISGGLTLAGVDVGPKLALIGAKVIVLGPSDSIPGGTPAGTVVVRTEV